MTYNENELMIRNVFPEIHICGPNVRVGADGSRMLSSWFAMGGSESAPPEPAAPQGDTAVIFKSQTFVTFVCILFATRIAILQKKNLQESKETSVNLL